jgi:hypothetical protein
MKEKKQKYYEYITKRECPFMPEINPESRKIMSSSTFRNEEKLEIYERLSRSKNKSKEIKIVRSRSKNSYNEIHIQPITTIKNLNNNINSNSNTKNENNLNKNKEKNSLYYIDSEGNRRVRTKITIREQKFENDIYNTLNQLSNENSKLKKSINKKIKENFGKFKLNSLKEIFEVIYSKCNSVEDIQNLGKLGISDNMKDNVILPTLHVIQERSLEFNFQNFYLIANEIISIAI